MDLIVKMLAGEISPEEKQELDVWLSKSKGNRNLFEEYQTIWESSENYSENSGYVPDVEAGYARLQEKIKVVESQPHPKQSSIIRKLVFYGAAASILFTIVAISSWLVFSQSSKTIIVATKAGETKSVTLDDGSKVLLNENSRLYHNGQFSATNRILSLDGEGFFDIKSDTYNPFLVKGNNTEVKVLGTSFNYKSYRDDTHSSVSVTSGKVQFSGKSKEDTYKFIILEKSEAGRYSNDQKNIEKESVAIENNVAWKTNKLVFKDTPIDIVFRDIEKFYKIKIDYSNSNVKKCKFNSIFEASLLNDVLENLKHSLEITITNTPDGTYSVSGGRNCK